MAAALGDSRCRRAELLLLLAVPPANIYQARAVAIAGFHERIKQSLVRVVPSPKSS